MFTERVPSECPPSSVFRIKADIHAIATLTTILFENFNIIPHSKNSTMRIGLIWINKTCITLIVNKWQGGQPKQKVS